MSARRQPEKPAGQHRRMIGILLGVVVIGGIASFVMRGGKEDEQKEEIVIVDLTAPPPPPPPPPPEPEEERPEPEPEEPSEIAEADAPDEMAEDTGDSVDLGLDAGDLASGPGSGGFLVNVARLGGLRGGGGGGGGLLDDVDAPPTPVSKIQPAYPSALLSKGIGGKVLVACVIDENGRVVSTTIKQSAHPDLDKAAMSAVDKWKFKPAQKAGRNVRAKCVVPFNFEVKKS